MARPAQYNPEDVIQSATQVFWDKGYASTSMAELIQATGLKPGSIYAGFGSKQALFEASIDYYAKKGLEELELLLSEGTDYLGNIRSTFSRFIEIGAQNQPSGCFLVNSLVELAPHDKEIQKRLKEHTSKVEQAFKVALTAAKESGQITSNSDISEIAKKIMVNLWGIRVAQRTGLTNQEIENFKKYYRDIV
ncbi:MAG: TetR/AcrR family transcriptional regulator [Kangiellaceae bacterium]|nr:TetR/AcrR family transcriptional regulator [Kangiellaceae bacterium]